MSIIGLQRRASVAKWLVADSLSHPISDYVARQLKQLYAQHLMQNGNLSVTVVPCQQQTNGSY